MRDHYRLRRETPELKKGAIVYEACEDGDQDYVVHPDSLDKIKHYDEEIETYREDPDPDNSPLTFNRDTVEKQPDFWEEVKPAFLSASEQKSLRRGGGSKGPVKRSRKGK